MRKGKDPDPEPDLDTVPQLRLMDPDPVGPKHADPAEPTLLHRKFSTEPV